jgi:hypothetical protein
MAAAYDRHQAVKFRLQAAIWHLGQVRVCQHKSGSPDRWMRLVPSRFFGMEGGAGFLGNPEEQISSTRIRAALTNISDKHEMVRALSGIALSPGLLFDYIQKHKREEARLLEQQEADAQDQEWNCWKLVANARTATLRMVGTRLTAVMGRLIARIVIVVM